MILIAIVNVVSASLFIFRVRYKVYDDAYNITDVRAYATKGVSAASILAQTNPPGPLGFIWMSSGLRLLGGDEVLDARIAALSSWILLIVGILIGAQFSAFPQLWYGAVLATLIFPHAPTAAATVLTEGPALLFAILGLLMWCEFASQVHVTSGSFIRGMLGGLSMGLSVVCRQYFLALLPASALFALCIFMRPRERNPIWIASVTASLVLAAAPVAALVLVWKGLSSPGIASGTSYSNWQANVGVNFVRPVVAAFYTAFYLLLLAFPAMSRVPAAWRRRALVIAIVGGAASAPFAEEVLQPGPLHSFFGPLSRFPWAEMFLFAVITGLTIYNLVAFGLLLHERKSTLLSNPPLVMALYVIAFFVLEQFGVGGNLPLYERYLLQLAPVLGIVAFSALEKLGVTRLIMFLAMAAVGQVMLWRYAFTG